MPGRTEKKSRSGIDESVLHANWENAAKRQQRCGWKDFTRQGREGRLGAEE